MNTQTFLKAKLIQYLHARGIPLRYAERAGVRIVDDDIAASMGFPYASLGIVFPYLHPLTREPHPTLMRIRYLGLSHRVSPDHGYEPVRYAQPKGSGVEAFFDANIDWMAVFRDQTISIRIVEGEAKALCLNQKWRAMDRTVTVALGGVWNFREKKGGKDLTPWLRMVRAASQGSRKVIITFDDDAALNSSIRHAQSALSALLGVRV